jgi:hypothetical protein
MSMSLADERGGPAVHPDPIPAGEPSSLAAPLAVEPIPWRTPEPQEYLLSVIRL